MRKIALYRDDSTVQAVYERVKQQPRLWRWPPYVHWPREWFCWFKDEPQLGSAA